MDSTLYAQGGMYDRRSGMTGGYPGQQGGQYGAQYAPNSPQRMSMQQGGRPGQMGSMNASYNNQVKR